MNQLELENLDVSPLNDQELEQNEGGLIIYSAYKELGEVVDAAISFGWRWIAF